MARLVESIEKLVSQQATQFSNLMASASRTSVSFGLTNLEDEEKILSELGWDVLMPNLPRHELLLKKLALREIITSFFLWMLFCRLDGYASRSAESHVLTAKVVEKLTPVEKEAVLAYINQKTNDGPKYGSTPPKRATVQTKIEVPVRYLPGCSPPKKKTPYEIWQDQRREEEALKQWAADEPNRRLRYKDMWDELAEFNRESDLYREELNSLTTDELKERWQAREWENEIEMNVLKAALRNRVL